MYSPGADRVAGRLLIFSVVMPAQAGIRYAAACRSIAIASEYWIAAFARQ
jgi:hypothetical protein